MGKCTMHWPDQGRHCTCKNSGDTFLWHSVKRENEISIVVKSNEIETTFPFSVNHQFQLSVQVCNCHPFGVWAHGMMMDSNLCDEM